MARDDQHPFDLSVVGTVSTSPKRDWVDGIFLGFTGILAFGTYLQWLSYIRQHRPKLIVGYMVLVKAPDELITLDETTGRSRVAPLGVGLVIENRGGNRCHIIEGNTTIVVVGDNNIANLFTAPTLPAFDTGLGVPAYDKGHEAFKKTIIRAGAREYRVHSMSVSQSIHDQVNTYMAVHPDRGVDNLRLFVFGYLRYRAIWPSPVYTTAFCRRYDRNKQAFIPVRDPRYDYRD